MHFKLLLSIVLVLLSSAAFAADPPVAPKYNVLFLMSDDLRPELGCYGHPQIQTPNIDALAKAGMRFDRAYCQYPLCNPSRSSLLTGRFPATTGVLDNTVYFRTAHPDWITLPQFFKQNGYATLRAGKIFHGGIDDVPSWTEGAEKQAEKEVLAQKKPTPAERAKNSDRMNVLQGDGESHGDYKSADLAIDYLRKHKDKPFFLACGFTKPHSPPTAPKRFYDLYDAAKVVLPANFAPRPAAAPGYPPRSITPNGDLFIGRDASGDEAKKMIQAYWASASWMDWNVGRVIAELDKQGLREKTIIVFWGDHGYHLGEWGKWSKHGSLYEIGTRVPLIVIVPGGKGNGKVAPNPVNALDIYPTLCELCGLKSPAGIEGHSLVSLLNDPATPWEHPAITVFGQPKRNGVAVRTSKFRYVEYDGGAAGAMLFDESADPHEAKNLAEDPAMVKVRAELSKLAKQYAPGSRQNDLRPENIEKEADVLPPKP